MGLLLAASVVIFLATEALPSDAAQIRTGGRAGEEALAALRAEAGLDRPLHVRYVAWLGGILTGDPGRSLVTGRPVAGLIAERWPVTASLAVLGMAVTVPLMAVLAWCAVRGRPALRSVATGVIVGAVAVPQVVVAAALVATLSAGLGLVPPVSLIPAGEPAWRHPELLVLPVLTLAVPAAAYGAGLLRGALGDALARPHVRDAELRGVRRRTVLRRYLLALVLPPTARILAAVAGAMVAGTAVVEALFGVTGLGELLVAAIGVRDVPVVQAVALLAAAVVIAGLLVADVVAVAVDPRARTGPDAELWG